MAILRTLASRRIGFCHRLIGASSLADRRSLPLPPFGAACEILRSRASTYGFSRSFRLAPPLLTTRAGTALQPRGGQRDDPSLDARDAGRRSAAGRFAR